MKAPPLVRGFGKMSEAMIAEIDALRLENIALRTLLLDRGLSEKQIHKAVERLGGYLRSYEESNLAWKKACEEFLALIPDRALETALRVWPGKGKSQ